MRTPPTFAVFRITAAAVTVLLLVLVGMGVSGHGPLDGLGTVTSHATQWLRVNTGVSNR
jgi:hypothetical protein